MNAMNVSDAVAEMGLAELRRIVVAIELRELKRLVEMNILRGIIGAAGDEDALLDRLALCRTAEDVDRLRRMARRWEYATCAKEPWVTWDEAYESTRN